MWPSTWKRGISRQIKFRDFFWSRTSSSVCVYLENLMPITRSFSELELLLKFDDRRYGNFCARNAHCDIFPYTHPYTKPLEIAAYATRSDTFWQRRVTKGRCAKGHWRLVRRLQMTLTLFWPMQRRTSMFYTVTRTLSRWLIGTKYTDYHCYHLIHKPNHHTLYIS